MIHLHRPSTNQYSRYWSDFDIGHKPAWSESEIKHVAHQEMVQSQAKRWAHLQLLAIWDSRNMLQCHGRNFFQSHRLDTWVDAGRFDQDLIRFQLVFWKSKKQKKNHRTLIWIWMASYWSHLLQCIHTGDKGTETFLIRILGQTTLAILNSSQQNTLFLDGDGQFAKVFQKSWLVHCHLAIVQVFGVFKCLHFIVQLIELYGLASFLERLVNVNDPFRLLFGVLSLLFQSSSVKHFRNEIVCTCMQDSCFCFVRIYCFFFKCLFVFLVWDNNNIKLHAISKIFCFI